MGKKRIITKAETQVQDETAASVSGQAKSTKKQVINGIANISVSYNNTIISIADLQGNVVVWSSAGLLGFRGTKKSTPYAANLVAKDCVEKSKKYNVTNVKIVVRGIGPARDAAIRGIIGTGLNVTSLMDVTPVPHNGVKAKKPRRV